MTEKELRTHFHHQLMQMGPNDTYHEGIKLDVNSYYAAMDRAIDLVTGRINHWTDLKPGE